VPQMAFDMTRQVQAGSSQFQIRLDPSELGAVDVRLDIDATGATRAHLIVEKAETLDLLQRDQRSLERALQQAGLDGAKTSLEFSLRQNNGGNGQRDQSPFLTAPRESGASGLDTPPDTTIVRQAYRGRLAAGGINIFA